MGQFHGLEVLGGVGGVGRGAILLEHIVSSWIMMFYPRDNSQRLPIVVPGQQPLVHGCRVLLIGWDDDGGHDLAIGGHHAQHHHLGRVLFFGRKI